MLFNELFTQFLTAEDVAHRLRPDHQPLRAGPAGPAEPEPAP
jgi:hypothetical protein